MLALVLALALPASAAAPRVSFRAAPVQLALPLFAPPKASAAPASAAAAAPAVALGSGLQTAGRAPDPVAAAFHTGDPAVFLKAVRAADYSVPEGDEQQARLLKEGLDREAADAWFDGRREPEPPAVRRGKLDYEEFGRRLSRRPVSESVFADAAAKRAILKASGYTHLKAPGGRVRIEDASDARVGHAFLKALQAYRSRR